MPSDIFLLFLKSKTIFHSYFDEFLNKHFPSTNCKWILSRTIDVIYWILTQYVSDFIK